MKEMNNEGNRPTTSGDVTPDVLRCSLSYRSLFNFLSTPSQESPKQHIVKKCEIRLSDELISQSIRTALPLS